MGVELDAGEEVHLGPRNPRFGGDATGFERVWLVVQMVDDEIEYLWRGARHCRSTSEVGQADQAGGSRAIIVPRMSPSFSSSGVSN